MGCFVEQSPVRIEAILLLCNIYLNQVHDTESFLTSEYTEPFLTSEYTESFLTSEYTESFLTSE